MTRQKNIFLIGPMGAGKTSIGKELARQLNMKFYDSDEVIEKRTGADIPWIFDVEGEAGFREREAKVIAELTKLRGIVLATGGSVVALPKNRATLAANGIIIYLKTSLREQIKRTDKSKKRPLSTEREIRQQTLQALRQEHNPLYEKLADMIYSSDDRSVKLVARDIIKKLQTGGYL